MDIKSRQTLDLALWFPILILGATMVAFLQVDQRVCHILILPFFILIILMLTNWKKALKQQKQDKE